MTGMNAAKAQEIVAEFEKGGAHLGGLLVGEAKGYLAAFTGPEVTVLVEAFKDALTGGNPKKGWDALAAFRAATAGKEKP